MPASSEINFIPEAEKDSNSVKDLVFQWVIKNGKRIVIFTQAVVLLVFISRFKFDTDIRNLVSEVESNQAVVESLHDTETRYLENQRRLGLIKPIIDKQVDWDSRLNEFNKKIPDDLTLVNVKFSSDNINLTATTRDARAFQIFVNLLTKDQTIQSAVLQSSQYDPEENEYSFVISMEI